MEDSKCVCKAGWVGEHCQYKTKCKTNDDCNGDKVTKSVEKSPSDLNFKLKSNSVFTFQGHGECVIVDSAVYRQGECFCKEGWQVNLSVPSTCGS